MPEGEESDFLHAGNLLISVAVCDPRCAGWWSAFCYAVRPIVLTGAVRPGHDPALHDAAAEPSLYRRYPRQAARRFGGPEEGRRHRGSKRFRASPLVETSRVAKAGNSGDALSDATEFVADREPTLLHPRLREAQPRFLG